MKDPETFWKPQKPVSRNVGEVVFVGRYYYCNGKKYSIGETYGLIKQGYRHFLLKRGINPDEYGKNFWKNKIKADCRKANENKNASKKKKSPKNKF